MSDLVKTKEAAAILGLDLSTVSEYSRIGRLRIVDHDPGRGHSARFRRSDVVALRDELAMPVNHADRYLFSMVGDAIHVEVNGRFFVIDREDVEQVTSYPWGVRNDGYVVAKVNRDGVYLHRVIAGASASEQVDHRNGDPSDCRRSNLRLCCIAENARNSRKQRRVTTSRFKGVSRCRRTGRWRAYIKQHGKVTCLGRFRDELDAARSYDTAALRMFGAFAKLNLAGKGE
jgi:hypothetical protein